MDVRATLTRIMRAAVFAAAMPGVAAALPVSTSPSGDTRMVQAFDQQLVPSAPTNATTSARHYRQGRVRLRRIPGATVGHEVRIWVWRTPGQCATEAVPVTAHARLGLRITTATDTYEDIVVDCPSVVIPAGPGPVVSLNTPLTACLGLAWAPLDSTTGVNFEVTSASIVDTDPFMVPGIRRFGGVCPTLPAAFPEERLYASGVGTLGLVQAMDACIGGSPNGALPDSCAPANSTTDGTNFFLGKLRLHWSGKVKYILKSSSIGGPLAGMTLRLDLTVRQTDSATAVTQNTLPDTSISCPPVVVPASGNLIGFHNLYTDCGLTPTNSNENVEIISLAIVNAATGEAVAVPGVREP